MYGSSFDDKHKRKWSCNRKKNEETNFFKEVNNVTQQLVLKNKYQFSLVHSHVIHEL